MGKPNFLPLLNFVLGFSFLLSACAPVAEATPEQRTPSPAGPMPTATAVFLPTPTFTSEPTPTASSPQIGSPDRPVKLLFVPLGDIEQLVAGAQLLAETLHRATGLSFEIVVPTTYAVTLEEMCASPEDTIGFLPALGYGVAKQLCDVRVIAKAVRSGYDWHAAMIVVAREGPLRQLTDLDDKKWVYPELTSAAAYIYPLLMLREAGVTPSESRMLGEHKAVIKAIYRREADFGTASFTPPYLDGKPIDWEAGQNADVPEELVPLCAPTSEGHALMCGAFEIRDARRDLRQELPDVVQKVRILTTTPKLPNDAVSFGPAFPTEPMQRITEALFAFAQNDPEGFANALKTYSWTSIKPTTDAEYAPIHLAIRASGLAIENLSP